MSVAAGAYGRHGTLDPGGREMFGIASHYQVTHALALLAVAWLSQRASSRLERGLATLAGWAFALGIVLFAGSLYWFGVFGLVPVEGGAPAGGMLLMLGWLVLIVFAVIAGRSVPTD